VARQDIAQALADGAAAGSRGDPPSTCPHPRTSLLRRAWVAGYARTRPLPALPDPDDR
jgi:hypothetical protein